jgi:transcriptional regulator GlxA family with amidase domain
MVEHTIPLKKYFLDGGFNNYSNFSKSFTRNVCFSPSELHQNEDSPVLKYPIVSFSG